MTDEEVRFRLGPRERRGLVAGWRPGQVLSAAIGCTAAGVVVAGSTSPLALLAAVVLVALGIAAGTIPLRGRTVDEWAPSLWRFARARGDRTLLDLELLETGSSKGQPEAACVAVSGAPMVVLRLPCQGVSLLEAGERDRLVAGLTGAMSLLAREGSAVARVSLSTASTLDDGATLRRDLRRRGRGHLDVAASSYRQLLDGVQLDLPGSMVDLCLRGRAERSLSSQAIEALLDEARQVLAALEDAGHPRGHVLTEAELVDDLQARVGPALRLERQRLSFKAQLRFDHVAFGERKARSWWVAEWTRALVTAELLSPIILGTVPVAMTVVFEPVAPGAALRRAQVARTKGAADDEVRRRGGFLSDRRRQREAEHLEQREAELIDGHGSLRFSGFLCVIAKGEDELRERSAAVELAAAQAGLRLQRCQGDHGGGLVASLPLTMGLR